MNDINLLRYHNRSAYEIHMLLNGEMKDKLFSRVVLGEMKARASVSKLVLFLTVILSFICSLFASYVVYHVVLIKDISIPMLDKAAIEKKVAEYQLELRTGGDPYLKEGYTKVISVDRAAEDDTPPVVVVSEYEPPIDMEAKPELFTKPIELVGEPEKRKRDKKELITPVLTGNYSIQFRSIGDADAAKVRTLAGNNDFKLTMLGTAKKSSVAWNAYKEDPKSGTVIAGKRVAFIKSFGNRNDAVSYLQKRKIAGVVASRTTYYNLYDMEVCCLNDEAAEKLARGSGIPMDKIKIIKK